MKNKRFIKTSIIALILCLATLLSIPISAATVSYPAISSNYPLKAYTISTGNNTPAYGSRSTSNRIGTIYASDEIYIYSIDSSWIYCSYPTANGRKYAYIPTSTITTAPTTTFQNYTSRAQITTYKRASTSESYGYISKNDTVIVIASSGSYYQVIYPISGGYKAGWIKATDFNNYILTSSSTSTNTNTNTSDIASSWQYPMTNPYCTWRSYTNMSWASYTTNSSGRNYHLGIDISGSSSTVYAAANGVVAAVGTNSSNGKYVIIKHTMSNGSIAYSFYAHLNSYSVSKNQIVNKGSSIGVMGNTGSSSSGSHLHFAIMDTLSSNGGYYGYATYFTGDKVNYGGTTFYNPVYVINFSRLP